MFGVIASRSIFHAQLHRLSKGMPCFVRSSEETNIYYCRTSMSGPLTKSNTARLATLGCSRSLEWLHKHLLLRQPFGFLSTVYCRPHLVCTPSSSVRRCGRNKSPVTELISSVHSPLPCLPLSGR
jgi:hypothetical protein